MRKHQELTQSALGWPARARGIVAAATVLGAAAVVGEESVDAAVGSRASRKDFSHGEVEDDASEMVAHSFGDGVDGNRRNLARRRPAVGRESRT